MADLSYSGFINALMRDQLPSMSNAFASGLLDATPEALELIRRVDASDDAAQRFALSQLADHACVHGDELFQRNPQSKGWHTVGLSVLLQAHTDHTLSHLRDGAPLSRALADALGLDYSSVHIGPYVMHAQTALNASLSDFARTCATMRLEACGSPECSGGLYGLNLAGTRPVHLAMQAQLCVSLRAESPEDARAMVQELTDWVLQKSREFALQFHSPLGEPLDVTCVPMMAGLPWSLRTEAAYEIQTLLFSQLARNWADAVFERDPGTLCFSLVPLHDEEGAMKELAMLVWDERRPTKILAAAHRTSGHGELFDLKLTRHLSAAGFRYREMDPASNLAGLVVHEDGMAVRPTWDERFPSRAS